MSSDTLVAPADRLGVRTQDDLFGGIVPAPPIATGFTLWSLFAAITGALIALLLYHAASNRR